MKTNNLLLATHRGFASGIYSALSLILGDTDTVKTVEVDVDDAMDLVCFRIDDALRSFPSDQPILLVTDIPGGQSNPGSLEGSTAVSQCYLHNGTEPGDASGTCDHAA